jgi:hypothetical protein
MEVSRGKVLGEHISKLIMVASVMCFDNLGLNLLMNKIIINLNVFCFFFNEKQD